MVSRDEQFRLKRNALLREAARAFSGRGYHNTSLDDVAAVLGVTKAALYHYVRSKQEILFECHMMSLDIGDEAMKYARTHGRTGILIYLSLDEHRAEIVADEAIAAKVAPEVWGDAMAAMLAHLRDGRLADGLVAAVEKVGVVLAAHFPRAEDDRNELPDRLIEV